MVKKLFWLCGIVVFVACNKDKISGSGNTISEERNVTGFNGLIVNGSTKAFVNIDTGFTVTVKGYENLLPYFKTSVVSGVLEAGFSDDVTVSNDNTEIYVTAPTLDLLETNGTGDINLTGQITGSDHLTATVNGLAGINIEGGNANNFEAEITGDGNISALDFQCKNATVNISGDGDVEISVSDSLDVTITGNGNVYYHGTPAITTHITGTGQVIPK